MQIRSLLFFWILIVGACLTWNVSGSPIHGILGDRHKIRHFVGCNFRTIRSLIRRACAYHSSENQLMCPQASDMGSTFISNSGEFQDSGRLKQDEELMYIRTILKECCPHENCPPLSQFCR